MAVRIFTSRLNPLSRARADRDRGLPPGFAVCVSRDRDGVLGFGGTNQDFGLATTSARHRLIAVADGVGMAAHSAIASQSIVRVFAERAETLINTSRLPLPALQARIARIYADAIVQIGLTLARRKLPATSAATTFIGVLETQGGYVFTHLADGSAYLLTQSADGTRMAAVPMLLVSAPPDVPPQLGALGRSGNPEILLVTKQRREGYLWIIATDGMNDLDRYLGDGKTHICGSRAAEEFGRNLWQAFADAPEEFGQPTIEAVLQRWLKRCQTTDDATVAVLLSGELYAHWQRLITADATPPPLA